MSLQENLGLVNDLYAEPKYEEVLGSFTVSRIDPEPKQTAIISRKRNEFQSKEQLSSELIFGFRSQAHRKIIQKTK